MSVAFYCGNCYSDRPGRVFSKNEQVDGTGVPFTLSAGLYSEQTWENFIKAFRRFLGYVA